MKRLLVMVVLICLTLSAETLAGGNAIMGWTPPTTYTDGTTIPAGGIKEYRLYSGTASGTYTGFVTIPSTTNQAVVTKVTGTYFFALTAVTQEGAESDYSNELSKYFPPQKPGTCTINWR